MGGVFGGGSSSSSSSSEAVNQSNTTVSVGVENQVNIDTAPIGEAIDRLISAGREAAQKSDDAAKQNRDLAARAAEIQAAATVAAASVSAQAQRDIGLTQQNAENLKLLFAAVSAGAALWAAARK